MKGKKLEVKSITMMGLLMAFQIILTRFLAIETPYVRVSFLFLATMVMGMIFGPKLTATGTVLSDFFGVMLFGKMGTYFPGFSISAILTGLTYGFFFYQKEITWKRVIIANMIVMVLVDMVLNTLWLYIIMGPAALANIPLRLIKSLILFPIKVAGMYALGNQGVLKKQILRFQN